MTIPLLNLKKLHEPLLEELCDTLKSIVQSAVFIGGPHLEQFERSLAQFAGTGHAIGVSSGSDALLVGLMALDLKPGDEVITTSYTFYATAGAIARLGAKPVFVDIDPTTYNIDPEKIEAAITDKTVGIIPVHLFGLSAEMDPILEIAGHYDLWVLEDAAQAIGAQYRGQKIGSIGRLGTYSFFPAKNLGALGDAGAVVTNDDALAAKIRALRVHGGLKKYQYEYVGGNFRLDALQAAFLQIKFQHLPRWQQARRRHAGLYQERLGDLPELTLPTAADDVEHVYNQYVVRTPRREELLEALDAQGIGTAIYYPIPLHLQPAFAHLGHRDGAFPESERAARETLAIPIDPTLDDAAFDEIAGVISGVLGSKGRSTN